MKTVFEKSKLFIYRNARPIELARWKYHFENGSKENVLKALSFYQNNDGGFAHALEADSFNPNSSPIQTWNACEIINELDINDNKNSIIQGILKYLASGKDFIQNKWLNTVPTNNDYPHASWWHCNNSTGAPSCNPTANLAGFIIKYAEKSSSLYRLGCSIAKESFDSLMSKDLLQDMHEVSCYIKLYEYIKEDIDTNLFDINKLEVRLQENVKSIITTDTDKWETSYICKPSQFFSSKNSIFYENNKEIADYECDFILKTHLEDGSYPVVWNWGNDYKEFEISKNWWKSYIVITNMLYLKGLL